MRDLPNKLISGKNLKNIQSRKSKSFGYQVLGFGAGGGTPFSGLCDFLVIAGGGGGGGNGDNGGGGGAGDGRRRRRGSVVIVCVAYITLTEIIAHDEYDMGPGVGGGYGGC